MKFVPRLNGEPLRVLALGAHCDDVEIGAGATVERLLRDHEGASLCIVIPVADEVRGAEATNAATTLAVRTGRDVQVHLGSLSENVLPSHLNDVRALVLEHGRPFAPHVVFAPHLSDRHQDHRVVAECAHQLFRDHPIFEYEIAKYDGDLHTPNVYAPVSEHDAAAKVDLIVDAFASQHSRTWFDREAFLGLMRLRGIECNARYAEGFHVRKLVI